MGAPGLRDADRSLPLTMFSRLKTWLAQKQEQAKAQEKIDLAKAFNDLYTYRQQFVKGMPYLTGTYYGVPHRSGYAWMCPECNSIHHPYEESVWDGLHYPACCSTPAGNRLDQGIRTSDVKR